MCNMLTGQKHPSHAWFSSKAENTEKHLEMKSATSCIAWAASLTKTSCIIIANFQEGASSHNFPICISRESDLCLKEQSVLSQKGLLAHRLVENWESALLNISEQLSLRLLWPQFSSLLFSKVIFQMGFFWRGLGFYLFGGERCLILGLDFFYLQFQTHDTEFVWEEIFASCLKIGITNL